MCVGPRGVNCARTGQPYRVVDRNGQPYRVVDRNGQPYRVVDRNGQPYRVVDRNGQPYRVVDRTGQPYRVMDSAVAITTAIPERPHAPSEVAAFMSAHSKTPYINPSMDFPLRKG